MIRVLLLHRCRLAIPGQSMLVGIMILIRQSGDVNEPGLFSIQRGEAVGS